MKKIILGWKGNNIYKKIISIIIGIIIVAGIIGTWYNFQMPEPTMKTKQIEVYLNDEKGAVRNILGALDPPVSPIPNKKKIPPGSRYKEIGIKYVTSGQATGMASGDFPTYICLDSIFLDNTKPADDKSNYDFRKIDKAMDSIIRNGITPMFQIMGDVNCYKDNCGQGYPQRPFPAEAYKPDDYDKWVAVAANVIKHFNGLFDVPRQARQYSAGEVKYFIIWDEPSDMHTPVKQTFQYGHPLWTGNFDDFWRLYEMLIDKLETDPEMAGIKDIIKIGGPSTDYGQNAGDRSHKFANKVIETKTRLDFISEDFYPEHFWKFVDGSTGITVWNELYNKVKNSDSKYSGLEWHLNAINFQARPRWQGYLEPGTPFYYPDANFESHYGAALLAAYLIYAEATELGSIIWHGGQGDFGKNTALVPVGFGNLFNGKARLQYAGLAYKMFSKMLSFDNEPTIKVTSKGEEINYSGKVRDQKQNKLVGYRKQDAIQVLSVKSKDKKKIKVLIANWNINPQESRYDTYSLKIKDTLDGQYNYKIFVIDKSHTFPERWTNQATWDIKDINIFPKEVQEKMKELEGRVEELISVYYPDRKNDKSIRYEGELGVAREGTIKSKNNEINLKISDVISSSVHLIELNFVEENRKSISRVRNSAVLPPMLKLSSATYAFKRKELLEVR